MQLGENKNQNMNHHKLFTVSIWDLFNHAGSSWKFEAWLSMQKVQGPEGLKGVDILQEEEQNRRCQIRMLHNAKEEDKKKLLDTWSNKSCDDAIVTLSKRDVAVTNQRDKKTQLDKLEELQTKAINFVKHNLHEKNAAYPQKRWPLPPKLSSKKNLLDLVDPGANPASTPATAPSAAPAPTLCA